MPPLPPAPPSQLPLKMCVQPAQGEVITSAATGSTYTIGGKIGEGSFGIVYSCQDDWENELAVKVLKPVGTYERVKASAQAEIEKLFYLRHPHITYVYDAFEYRDTFYIVTEKCLGPLSDLFTIPNYDGIVWLLPVARCLLQAVHYIHRNNFVHQDIHLGKLLFKSVCRICANLRPSAGNSEFRCGGPRWASCAFSRLFHRILSCGLLCKPL